MRRTIVISAVSIRKGGTLTILRDCLEEAARLTDRFRVIAIVHDRKLCEYPGIEYIEITDTLNRWDRRLWAEYVTFGNISRKLEKEDGAPVYLWLSLHDTTPRVKAERQAVYCQTSFPFMKTKAQDWRFDFKIALFAKFTKYVYKFNVHRNMWLIAQTEWLRKWLGEMLHFPVDHIVVSRPVHETDGNFQASASSDVPVFFFPSTPDCHKNFETLCEASRLLEAELGPGKFKTILTFSGEENRYASWLKSGWGSVKSIDFHGFMSKDELFRTYAVASCLVFPSRVETWGLPISEFAPTGKPMILSDLPYAHETSAGCDNVAFFDVESPESLKAKMKEVIDGQHFDAVPAVKIAQPQADSWEALFNLLLS